MKEKLFVICEPEKAYLYNFLEFYQREENEEFKLKAFTSAEELLARKKEGILDSKISILLINECLLSDEILGLEMGQLILLTEKAAGQEAGDKGFPLVKKYQSAEELLKKVFYIYSDREEEQLQIYKRKETQFLGVYSVCGRSLKTFFSMTAGMVLAETYKTLYLNMEGYSGFREYFQVDYARDLSDILFRIREGKTSSMLKISEVVRSVGKLHYIPPVQSPMDFSEMRMEDWKNLIHGISEFTDYERVVLDFGENIPQVLHLLEECRIIFMPTKQDALSQAKLIQFEKSLEWMGKKAWKEKIQLLKMPEFSCFEGINHRPEELVLTAFGDYVREVLRR